MSWVDNKIKSDNLLKLDIAEIESIEIYFFKITFKKMTEQDRTSILMRLNNPEDRSGEKVLDFIQWLFDRNVEFSLGWVPNGKKSSYVKTFLYIQELKLKQMMLQLRRMITKNQ